MNHNSVMSSSNSCGYSLRQGTRKNYRDMNTGQKSHSSYKRKSNHHDGHYKLKKPRRADFSGTEASASKQHDGSESVPPTLNPYILNSAVV